MIFSVMASPNRIDILRILNTKGPLTYSELKALAGFKSKKESGKFAYHLRKLLRQLLVALNKAERRYTITNLGKLVLSLARQIEERSIIESGKMYVRTTSRQSIEEFNSHKIIQSLVREANLPLEQAHKITEEVENKIYKFQTAYLTSSLIRETVNSVLIEHGHEEYRNKLARLGLPPADIAGLLASDEATRSGVAGVMGRAASAVFSEYLVFNTLPKDIADMHLAGEINIASAGTWSLLPDTIFVDLSELDALGLQGRFPAVARLPLKSADDMLAALPVLISLLGREASSEIVLEGVAPALANKGRDATDDLASKFARALMSSSAGAGSNNSVVATIAIPADTDARTQGALLEGYRKYVEATPSPRIGLAVGGRPSSRDALDQLVAAVRSGGIVTVSGGSSSVTRASSGIRKTASGKNVPAAMALQSLSINLPRLAFESNKDETYFRAKLALMIKPSLAAMAVRKKAVADNARRGLLPAFASATAAQASASATATSSMIVNLTGARESVYSILGHEEAGNGAEVLQKVLKTAVEVAASEAKKLGEDPSLAGIAMVADDSGARFAMLDSEKYGKVSPLLQSSSAATTSSSSSSGPTSYSQGMLLAGKELLADKGNSLLLKECAAVDRVLNGGFAAAVDVTDMPAVDVAAVLEQALSAQGNGLAFLRAQAQLAVCAACGKKYRVSLDRCDACKSPQRL
jgi:ribonucleoside-triphosphate reductase